jgi:hypothetical protein
LVDLTAPADDLLDSLTQITHLLGKTLTLAVKPLKRRSQHPQ